MHTLSWPLLHSNRQAAHLKSLAFVAVVFFGWQSATRADLSLETETARLLAPGHWSFSLAGEYQFSRDGGEFALPLAIEVGIFERLELLVEPTPYVGIYPKNERKINGFGDTEITVTFLALKERPYVPAMAFAAEVKAPTAGNLNIGTRKIDLALYAIASKQFGILDVHANVAYTILGKPTGVHVRNTWSFALAGDLNVAPKWDLFAEVMYTTSARGPFPKTQASNLADGADSAAATAVSAETAGDAAPTPVGNATAIAEVGGVELIGTLGVRRHVSEHFSVFGSFSYDNADAKLVRIGCTVGF